MTLDYASDDLPEATGLDKFLLRAKAKGFLRRKLFQRSKRKFGERNDLARLYALKRFGMRIGKYTYDFKQFCHSGIMIAEIGSFCSIAKNVTIPFSPHPLQTVSTHPSFYMRSFGLTDVEKDMSSFTPRNTKVTIGHDVWIGTNALIIPGVTIGTGAVIGAGAVVTKDVPPYAIVTGVPATVLRYRFDPDTIQKLLAIKWWLWDDEKIKNNISHFFNTADFCTKIH